MGATDKPEKLFWGKLMATLLFATVVVVAVYKAIHVPITHDEKSASVYYAWMPVWGILMSDIWPSNHILNSLLVKLSENIFGIQPWSVRLPSMLALFVFGYVLWLIAIRYFSKHFLLFCIPIFLIFGNPFLIDFYSLARGYGLSNALMACSIYGLLLFADKREMKWFYLTIVFSMLAAYANFTLLIYWVAVHLLLGFIFLTDAINKKRTVGFVFKHITYTTLVAFAFMALCFTPLYKMQTTNQFVYWSKESFFKDTVVNQIENLLYGKEYWHTPTEKFAKGLWLFLKLLSVFVLVKAVRKGKAVFTDPLAISFFILLLVCAVNKLQTVLLGTPFLTGRTALSYFVLLMFVFMFLIRQLDSFTHVFRYTLVPVVLIFCVMHLRNTVNLTSVREWKYDSDTYAVMDYLKAYIKEHPDVKTVDLNTSWIYNPSFGFYCMAGITPWINLTEYHKEVDTTSHALFYYATHDDGWQLEKNYRSVLDFPLNSGVLMQRK